MKSLIILAAACLPAAVLAATPIDERRPLDADARVEVENVKGRIVVSGWDRNEAHITGSLGDGVKELVVDGEGSRLSVRVEYPQGGGWFGWNDGGGGEPSDIQVKVPRGVSLEIDAVSADVDVDDIAGRSIVIDAVSGDVVVKARPAEIEIDSVSGDQRVEVDSDSVNLESVSGSITARGSMRERITVEAVSGDIDIAAGAVRTLGASTVSGDVSISASPDGGRLRVESMSGDVDLRLPSSASAELTASSFSGSIRSDVGDVQEEEYGPGSSLNARMGGGAAEVHLETFSGDVRIRTE